MTNSSQAQLESICGRQMNPTTDDKMLALSNFTAFADNNFKVAAMVQFLFDRVENIVVKGENAGYQHFLLLPICFQKAFSLNASIVVIVR